MHLAEGALIALVPAVLVALVLWLPLRGFLAKRASIWRRRIPISLLALVLFGICGRLAEEFTGPSYETPLRTLDHFTVLYGLVGLVFAMVQNPDEIIETAKYARSAFWISVFVTLLATIGVGFSVLMLFRDEHNVTTGMSSGAVGLLGLIVCVPTLLISTIVALLFWRAGRK